MKKDLPGNDRYGKKTLLKVAYRLEFGNVWVTAEISLTGNGEKKHKE